VFEKLVLAFPMEDCCEGNECKKGDAELLVTGGNAPVPFDRAEEVLNPVALAVEAAMEWALFKPGAVQGKAGENVLLIKHGAKRIGVIAFVGHEHRAAHCVGPLHEVRSQDGVAYVASAQEKPHGAAPAIHERMDLGGKTSSAWPHRLHRLSACGISGAAVYPHVGAVDGEEFSFGTFAQRLQNSTPEATIPPMGESSHTLCASPLGCRADRARDSPREGCEESL
jgi:hypothetical protein